MSPEQQTVLNSLESGSSVSSACREAGISRKLFYQWLKDEDVFREAIMHSDLADIVTIEDILFVKAMSGSAQDRKLYFERREGKAVSSSERNIQTLKRMVGVE